MPTQVRALHDDMVPLIAERLKGFVSKRADGALLDAFAPMLRFLPPSVSRPVPAARR